MKKRKVSEAMPVQVYLGAEERARLERLARDLDASRADVLRRGLEALERELLDPKAHPVLRLVGIGEGGRGPRVSYDVNEQHDRYLADALTAKWEKDAPAVPRGRGGKKRRRGRS